jgi:hypothetical protein
MSATTTITRTVVNGGFSAARMPLTLAEKALRRGDRTDAWPPALAFETIEANVKGLVGSLTGDDRLVDQSRLVRAKITQLRKGVALETLADEREREADEEFRERREADARRRRQVDEDAAKRKRAADERARTAARQAAHQLDQQAQRAAVADAVAEAAAEKAERAARRERVRAERGAVSEQRKAVATKEEVAQVTDELEASKATRRAR